MENNYSAGHCWYYKLKGCAFTLKEILNEVKDDQHVSFLEDTFRSDNSKDDRTIRMLKHRDKCLSDLKRDISLYRKYFLRYNLAKKKANDMLDENDMDLCVSVSLKYCHIYNGFSHLILIDELLNGSEESGQSDMFGF